MLRELSAVLLEMQASLAPYAGTLAGVAGADGVGAQVRLADASIELPLDLRVVLADGGAQLQADVPRSLDDLHWRDGCSRIRLRLQAWPCEPCEAAAS